MFEVELLNDLKKEGLEVNVDIKSMISSTKLNIDGLLSKNTNDLKIWLKDYAFKKTKFLKIYKWETKNFDSLVKIKKSYYFWKYKKSVFTIDLIWRKDLTKNLDKDNIKLPIDIVPKHKIAIYKMKYFSKEVLDFIFKRTIFLSIVSLVFFCIVFSAKFFVEYKISNAYKNLIDIKEQWYNENSIKSLLSSSIRNFQIWSFVFFPFSLIPSEQIQNTKYIISWWKNIAISLEKTINIYDKINEEIKTRWIENVELTKLINYSKEDIFKLEEFLIKALNDYSKVTNLNNDWLNKKFEDWKKYLADFSIYTTFLKDNFQTFLNIIWDKKEKKYLIVFQNADEIRPMWWFMWSMWIITLDKWKLIKFDKEDVYSYEWNLKKADYIRLKAPEWLNKVTWVLSLRDANYFINPSVSSDSIKFFINKAWYDIDWIIYINNTIIENFLKLTWNITFTKLWENIKEKNFSKIMSLLVESKKFKSGTIWTPKQILFDFIEEFKDKLKRDWDYLAYMKIILENIRKREVIIWSFSPKENELLSNLWLNWKIDYNSSFDFSYPVYTSISWNKSDRYMKRAYEKTVKINDDCSINTSLKISLTHNFSIDEELYLKDMIKKYEIKDKNIMYIQWLWDNWQYVRLVLPKNAEIPESKDYKILETENLKTVSFYLKTKRFEKKSLTINYKLQNKSCTPYTYNLYKQAWIRKYDFIMKDDNAVSEEQNITEDFKYKK